MKRLLSLLLAVAMVVLVLAFAVSCGDKPENTTASTTTEKTTDGTKSTTSSSNGDAGTTASSGATSGSDVSTSDTDSTTDTTVSSENDGRTKHPDYQDVNFGGRTFKFAASIGQLATWDFYEITAESTGDDNIITEGIIARNAAVESLYNCKIECDYTNDAPAYAMNDMQQGKHTVDFILWLWNNAVDYDWTYNIANMDIDFSHSWWDQNYHESFSYTVDGVDKCYNISGKFNLLSYDATWSLFFNKDVYERLVSAGKTSIDIYDEVRKGTWTMDKMISLMDAAKSDVNGDQNMKYEDGDIFGCVTINNQYFATSLITAAGLRMTTKENGTHHAISSQNTDVKAYSAAIDKAIELWQSPAFLSTSGSNTQSSLTNGQALFVSEVLTVARRITDENARFSIVPIPKYSEDQEDYAQLVCTTGAGLKVSASITDIKATADFLEVFGYHSEKILYPAYINYYKTQCFCEDESGEMLDIVLRTRVWEYDNFRNGGMMSRLTSFITSGKNQFTKALASMSNSANSVYDAHMATLKKLK